MALFSDALGGARVIVEFDPEVPDDWAAAAEVLNQEGLRAWALPVGRTDLLPEAISLFGRRSRIGVWGVTTAAQAAAAAASGAHFITSLLWEPGLAEACGETPFVPGALTPTEIGRAVAGGASTVQVVPADAFGMTYSRTVPALFPGVEVVAAGKFERFQAEMWLDAGAAAVALSRSVVKLTESDDGEHTLDLDEVRRHCQTYRGLA